MRGIEGELDQLLDGWLRQLQQARADGDRPPLEVAKLQTLEDVTWYATPTGSGARLGKCVCLDGYAVETRDGVDVAVPCACRPLAVACDRYTAAGVPTLQGVAGCGLVERSRDPARGLDWRRYPVAVRSAVTEWLKGALTLQPSAPTMLLNGSTGTGKTHVAAGVVRSLVFSAEWRGAPYAARWVRWRDYLDACRGERDERKANERAQKPHAPTRKDIFRRCRLLVVDELTACAKEWGATELEDLLDIRSTASLVTVFTSNVDDKPKQDRTPIAAAFGDRAESRLVGGGVVVEMASSDYRKAVA